MKKSKNPFEQLLGGETDFPNGYFSMAPRVRVATGSENVGAKAKRIGSA